MRRLNPGCERVLDDLRSGLINLVETEDEAWESVLAECMNEAWDALARLAPEES